MRKILLPFIVICLVITLVNCSSKNDQEYYDSALKNLEEENFADALMDFENLISDFPESKFAPASMYEIGRLYHGRALKNLNSEESLRKGVDFYKKVFDTYPDSKEAPNSLFMAAFILANELNDLTTAKGFYEIFVDKYPDSELYDDAKSELDNLGKSPEEILNSKKNEEE